MRRTVRVSLIVATAVLLGSCGGRSEMDADLVLTGGLIWYGPGAPVALGEAPTALAVVGGKVLALGTDEEIEGYASASTERIDLAGRRVVPGFMDSHTHFVAGGFELAGVQLRDAATPEELARRIGEFAAAHPGEWVTGGAWDHELWGGELPRRDWIDSLTPGTPVFVTRLDGHMGLANSRALELAGVTAETPDPPGGTIVRYPDGRPSGILKDDAMTLVWTAMPLPSEDERDRALQAALEYAAARGVTMVTDMGSWEDLETYRRAQAGGALPIRVYSVVPLSSWEQLAEFVDQEGRGDHRLLWGGLKGFVDGSLGSTTAWFYEPYDDEPSTAGLVVIDDTTEFKSWITFADAAGLQVVIHAIGDRANDWLLDAYAEARAANGPRDRRFRIEHAQHLTRDAIARIAADGVIPAMQPYHAIDDGRWAGKRIGPERIKTTYAFRSLIDAGARLSFGSDWTVAPIDPLYGIYAAVTRRTIDGANPGGWVPAEKISVAEAVTAYTAGNAYASHLEDVLGELAPGKYADLVVLSADIFAVDPAEIESVKVDLTMVEGRVVYRRGN
ncbi:MAG: amidohydrolase [Gemmatimonadota bacterium]|nr:MAG: amidohydrolase [Gemmatimonadota bacterium]